MREEAKLKTEQDTRHENENETKNNSHLNHSNDDVSNSSFFLF